VRVKKIDSLTGIRGIAALWVVFFHFRHSPGIQDVINFDRFVARGYWGVDFFFVLSGFVLSYNYYSIFNKPEFGFADYRRFLVKRLARIYPLHLFTLLIHVLLLYIGYQIGQQIVFHSRCSLNSAIGNVFLVHAWGFYHSLTWNYPSWSISAEWFAYLIVLLLGIRYFPRMNRSYHVLTVAVMWAAMIIYTLYIGETVSYFSYNSLPRVVTEFLAGCLLYRIVENDLQSRWSDLTFLIGFGGVAVLTQLGSNYEFLLLPLVSLSIYSLCVGSSLGKVIFGNRIVVFLGEISYSIYLMHATVYFVGSFVVGNTDFSSTVANAWIILIIYVSSVLILSTASFYLVERPSRRALISAYDKLRPKLRFL
jgi:peptidoglycan/LPS O-acetylase OafA/YrhL